MAGAMKKVFVTVGTTSFDKLINVLCDISTLRILLKRGYSQLTLQIGAMQESPAIPQLDGIKVELFNYKDTLASDVASADLIISHAGAGSCLDALGAKKPLVVVINEDLMNNHQTELADRLDINGHAFCTTCRLLPELLNTMDLSRLKAFEPGHPEKFASLLDKLFGFS